VDRRHDALPHDTVGLGSIVRDVEPHRRQRVRKGIRILAVARKQLAQVIPCCAVAWWFDPANLTKSVEVNSVATGDD
jgi:hypothetical protein